MFFDLFYNNLPTLPLHLKLCLATRNQVHTRLEDIINNHFERYTFLDSVRDRNKISAVPNLLAQPPAVDL